MGDVFGQRELRIEDHVDPLIIHRFLVRFNHRGSSRVSFTVFSQLFPLIALTRFWGVCFRSQRLRLTRLMGVFSDSFFTVVAATAMLYGLSSTLLQYWFSAASTGKLHAPAEVSVLAV